MTLKKAKTTQYCKMNPSARSAPCGRERATHRQPLGIIRLARAKQGSERVVSGDDEAGDVGQELAAEIEQDKEEVERSEAEHGIGLGDRRLLLEVVQDGVLGELRHGSVSENLGLKGAGQDPVVGQQGRTSLSSSDT